MSPLRLLNIIALTLSLVCPSVGLAQDFYWVQVRIPVACIRDGKGHSTEMTSQAILGTPLKVFERDGEWLKIQSPDGYEGYMNVSSVTEKTEEEMARWRKSERYVSVSLPEVKLYATPEFGSVPRNVVSELVMSSVLEGSLLNDSVLKLTTPDGRLGYAHAASFKEISDWAATTLNMDSVVDMAYELMGTPYLWGACSTKSVDCSGLVRVCYLAHGTLTLRDARQQIEIGQRIEPENPDGLRRGDLLFFSNTPDGRISHVAIYDTDKKYIHSSGLVKTNFMLPDDPDFSKRFYRGASRIEGMEGTEGIIKMINHPWYFNINR